MSVEMEQALVSVEMEQAPVSVEMEQAPVSVEMEQALLSVEAGRKCAREASEWHKVSPSWRRLPQPS